MLSVFEPDDVRIADFLERQARLSYSYAEVGATRGEPPAGYSFNIVRRELGRGEVAFAAAKSALLRWEHFNTSWTAVRPDRAPVREGQVVAVLAWALGVWSLNACRIIYTVDDPGPPVRFGFGYGTLPGHMESGEERFIVEWDRESDIVYYEIAAFFRPRHFLAKLGWLYGLQKVNRFRRESAAAMAAAVNRLAAQN